MITLLKVVTYMYMNRSSPHYSAYAHVGLAFSANCMKYSTVLRTTGTLIYFHAIGVNFNNAVDTPMGKSFTNSANKRVPRTLPCLAPLEVHELIVRKLLTRTNSNLSILFCICSIRKEATQRNISSHIPKEDS